MKGKIKENKYFKRLFIIQIKLPNTLFQTPCVVHMENKKREREYIYLNFQDYGRT